MTTHSSTVETAQMVPIPRSLLEDLDLLPNGPDLLFIEPAEGGFALRTLADLLATEILPYIPFGPIRDVKALLRATKPRASRILNLPRARVLADNSIELPPALLLPAGTHVSIRVMPPRLGHPWLLLEPQGGPDPDETPRN